MFFIFSIFVISAPVFSGTRCPSCNYSNDDKDRYCINCSKEMRPLTREEKKRLEQEAKKAASGKPVVRKVRAREKLIPSVRTGYEISHFSYMGIKLLITAQNTGSCPITGLVVKVTVQNTDSISNPAVTKTVELVSSYNQLPEIGQKTAKEVFFDTASTGPITFTSDPERHFRIEVEVVYLNGEQP